MTLGNKTPNNFQETRRAFLPKFDTKLPIERDNEGRQISGTGVVVLQGFTKRSIVNGDTGESVSKSALVFACLGSDGRFKNMPNLTNEKMLEIAFERFEIELPIIQKVNPIAAIPGMEGFEGCYDIDWDKLYEVIYPVRGRTFTGILNRQQSKRGVYYYAIDLNSLKPVLVNGEHHQLQKPENTRPEVTDFDWIE